MGYTSHISGRFHDPRDVKEAIEEGELDKAHLVVGWKADEWGYTVSVFDASTSQPVCEYTAGNSPWDSQLHVTLSMGVGEDMLRKWAQQTAAEFANEIGLPQNVVFEEED